MKFNQAITIVCLALSFCVFDQMKDKVIERIGDPDDNHKILTSSVSKAQAIIPETCSVGLKKDCSVRNSDMTLVGLGKKVYKVILFSAL
ncbi:hypothetical protein QQ020_20030 [Fulvivirgaceae bacterium BMA12]|uniref:Lipoprotein n=1 Tax=Agaribacillus aureus TaxID=3051825 RepID=A0ABT8L9E3_9BACT|nr:hypothetical protein [Fulvivirgaceae bacterium BMA12]